MLPAPPFLYYLVSRALVSLSLAFFRPQSPAFILPADSSHPIYSLPESITLAACSCLQPLTLAQLTSRTGDRTVSSPAGPPRPMPPPGLSPFRVFPVTSIFSSFCPLICFSLLPSPTHTQLECLLCFLALFPLEIPSAPPPSFAAHNPLPGWCYGFWGLLGPIYWY